MSKRNVRRRDFLALSMTAGGMFALAACSPAATPTAAPKAAEPTKPAAPAAPATAPTTAPASAPTAAAKAAVEPTKPAAAATAAPATAAKPTAAAQAAPPKLGATLIGKIEGPEIILDAAAYPKAFKEAPQLADLVKAGKLPPVEKRLPEDIMVIKPLGGAGKYGGTWRRGFTGPADSQNGHRAAGGDRLLHWHPTKYPQMVPNVAKAWKYSADFKTLTVNLRKGMKWSDGSPFTADDIMFWFEDFYQNKDLNPSPSPYMSINGKPGTIAKVDDYTVEYRFPEAYPMFVQLLGSSIPAFGGPAVQGGTANAGGGFGPKAYLSQFHTKYVDKATLDKKVADAKFDNWTKLYLNKASWHLNPDLPVLTPWKTVTPANTPTWTLERNPYYWTVDTDGNQLPYIDKISFGLAENLEVLNLRSVAGEFDFQSRHNDIAKVPVFLENQQKGNYKLMVDPAQNGTEAAFRFNLSFNKDPEIGKWISNRDFRRALSLGIDRDQINETIFLGIGTPGSTVPSDDNPYNPGPEYRKLWSVLDIKQATDLLDKIGLAKKDADGFRVRTDNGARLQLEVATVGGAFIQFTQLAEMVKEQWKKIGVWVNVVEMERSLWVSRYGANDAHITVWQNDGSDETYLYPANFLPFGDVGTSMGVEYAKWLASGGKQGIEPKDPAILKGWDLFIKGPGQPQEDAYRTGKELWKIVADEVWAIGTVGQSGAFMGIRVVKNTMGNTPARQLNIQCGQTPNISRPCTFYFKA